MSWLARFKCLTLTQLFQHAVDHIQCLAFILGLEGGVQRVLQSLLPVAATKGAVHEGCLHMSYRVASIPCGMTLLKTHLETLLQTIQKEMHQEVQTGPAADVLLDTRMLRRWTRPSCIYVKPHPKPRQGQSAACEPLDQRKP